MAVLAEERRGATLVELSPGWYASAAGVIKGMSSSPVLPVGRPLWGRLPLARHGGFSSAEAPGSLGWRA